MRHPPPINLKTPPLFRDGVHAGGLKQDWSAFPHGCPRICLITNVSVPSRARSRIQSLMYLCEIVVVSSKSSCAVCGEASGALSAAHQAFSEAAKPNLLRRPGRVRLGRDKLPLICLQSGCQVSVWLYLHYVHLREASDYCPYSKGPKLHSVRLQMGALQCQIRDDGQLCPGHRRYPGVRDPARGPQATAGGGCRLELFGFACSRVCIPLCHSFAPAETERRLQIEKYLKLKFLTSQNLPGETSTLVHCQPLPFAILGAVHCKVSGK